MPQLTLHEYQHLAMRTAKEDLSMRDHLAHAALGMTGDAGEFANCIRDHLIYGKMLDLENALEELGDLLWFVQYACRHLGVSLEDVARMNLEKLRKRYPGRYTDAAAIERLDKK